MKIHETAINPRHPKLCHARVGQCVRIYDTMTPQGSELFLVCADTTHRVVRPSRLDRQGLGLYSETRPLFLVSLASGEAAPMPHLSSRVEIVHDAQVYVGKQLSKALRDEENPKLPPHLDPALSPAQHAYACLSEAAKQTLRDLGYPDAAVVSKLRELATEPSLWVSAEVPATEKVSNFTEKVSNFTSTYSAIFGISPANVGKEEARKEIKAATPEQTKPVVGRTYVEVPVTSVDDLAGLIHYIIPKTDAPTAYKNRLLAYAHQLSSQACAAKQGMN